jgi:hypothetical protein
MKLRLTPRLLLLPALLLLGATAGATPARATPPAFAAAQPRAPYTGETAASAARGRPRIVDYEISIAKAGLVAAALGLFGYGLRLRQAGQAGRHLRARRAALGLLALASLGSYYNFFLWQRPHVISLNDVYHYYLGAKYFPELGYGGLYECTLAAASEEGWGPGAQTRHVRDLRSMRLEETQAVLARSDACKTAFTPERWGAFKRDLRFFRERFSDRRWAIALADHGYNPSPVWTLFGRPLTTLFPAEPQPLLWLVRIDLALVLGTLLAIGWAFGFETAALAAVVWGTGFLWRYGWIGDSVLRQLWFASSCVGLALLARGRGFAAGALLALSALLRLFPAAFIGGYALHALRRAAAGERPDGEALRFGAGMLAGGVVLVAASLLASGRGPEVYAEFLHNTRALLGEPAWNKLGLPSLLWLAAGAGPGPLPAWCLLPQAAAAGAFGWLFWRALPGLQSWEAAAAGFAWIPVLTNPGCYYFSFVIAAALLARRRPRIGVGLLAACLAWLLGGIAFFLQNAEYVLASCVALAFSVFVLIELRREPLEPGWTPR